MLNRYHPKWLSLSDTGSDRLVVAKLTLVQPPSGTSITRKLKFDAPLDAFTDCSDFTVLLVLSTLEKHVFNDN